MGTDIDHLVMAPTDRLKILVLDDEKQFTEELMDFFKDLPYDSYQANTVNEGMNILKDHRIDLLFLDVRLPGANGLDVLREVRIKYPGMVVSIVSAYVDNQIVNHALQLGAFDYLRKPFRYIDIQIAIERAKQHLLLQQKIKTLEEQLIELRKLAG